MYDIAAQNMFNDENTDVFGKNKKIEFSFLSDFETDYTTLDDKIK